MTQKPELHIFTPEANGLLSLDATFVLFTKLMGRPPTDQERADAARRYAELTTRSPV